ncbi:hypothetical protein IGI04_007424 [Brassica rapa subsp. trilocularis]|uniref:Uncharacterized protein n=1 Tax=Brassica rapa subsp. trilocularis TaxID=1813537 RepID=A0ABQ7NJU0_BRACM|nr:hypothetical protein IGI04_007424 [Brassica rapa subsp. trilocularis]
MKNSEKYSEKRSEHGQLFLTILFGVLKLRITYVLQPLILIDGQGEYSDQPDPCDGSEPRVIQNLIVYSLSRKSRIAVNWSCDMDQGHEDTMMGSHPGGRVTACSVGCSILEYLMEMMVTSRWETFTLGREGTALASVRVPYDISPCPDELTIRYCFLGLKSLEWYPIGALVFFDCWSKAIGSILRTSDRPSRNIDRVNNSSYPLSQSKSAYIAKSLTKIGQASMNEALMVLAAKYGSLFLTYILGSFVKQALMVEPPSLVLILYL